MLPLFIGIIWKNLGKVAPLKPTVNWRSDHFLTLPITDTLQKGGNITKKTPATLIKARLSYSCERLVFQCWNILIRYTDASKLCWYDVINLKFKSVTFTFWVISPNLNWTLSLLVLRWSDMKKIRKIETLYSFAQLIISRN